MGDELLRKFAERIRAHLGTNMIVRLGGDEFVLLLEDAGDSQIVENLARDLLEAARAPMTVLNTEVSITVSIGIATWPADGDDMNTLLRRADAAMYSAKRTGRNQYKFFTRDLEVEEDFEILSRRKAIESAWAGRRFVLHYQPQLSLTTKSILAAEALLALRR